MRGDARFWRNVAMIALAHTAVVLGLVRWSGGPRKSVAQNITWMDAAAFMPESAVAPPAVASARSKDLSPTPEPEERTEPPVDDEPPTLVPAKSEIELPTPTAIPTLTPQPHPSAVPTPRANPKATATPMPKSTPKPKPKGIPKKAPVAKVTPKPSPKPVAKRPSPDDADRDVPNQPFVNNSVGNASEANGGAAPGRGSAKRGSQFGWYGSMLHDRLYREWVQPTSVVASGATMSALVQLRIEKDGRVSQFNIVRPSGNVVVDESVIAVAKRVTQVDPLPKGLGGEFYEVKINFELNPE